MANGNYLTMYHWLQLMKIEDEAKRDKMLIKARKENMSGNDLEKEIRSGGAGTSSLLPCKIDLACDLSKANPVCSERFGEGATCGASSGIGSSCKSSLRCAAGQGTTALTCQRPGLAGEGCVSGSCSTDLFCETSSKTCKAVVVAGSVCTQADSCKAGSTCTSGVCKNFVTSMVCN